MANKVSVGLNIREFRTQRGMVLRDLSQASGVSVSYLSELERDGGGVSVDVLRRVARGLDVSLVDLLDESHTHAWATCPQCQGKGAVRVDLRNSASTRAS